MASAATSLSSKPARFTAAQLPKLNFQHIGNLTDDKGIMQQVAFTGPIKNAGYFIDDNARALLLAVWAARGKKNPVATSLIPTYLGFIQAMQTKEGYFRKFMNDTRVVQEELSTEDSFGRTMMALGFLINDSHTHLLVRTGAEIFSKAYPHVNKLVSVHSIANTIIGICQVIKYHFPVDQKRDMLVILSNKLIEQYEHNKKNNWHWFEPALSSDNALLPLALLNAYEITQEENYLQVAFESMEFLESKVFHGAMLRPEGKKTQCNDAMAMVIFYQQAFRLTREEQYLSRMYTSFQWFLGVNDLRKPLYDASTGGCADGLNAKGIIASQGAESTLAYWISHVVVASALAE